MKVTRLPDVESGTERSVAVGTFDGVHLGHREVIRGSDSVLTFDPHPVSVVAPAHTPKLLTPLARKAELVAELGVRELIVIPFDASFAACSATEFIDDVLLRAVNAKQVAIGENFRFGHKAQGSPPLLAADTRFRTVVHPLLEVDGEIVSSSHIRGLVLAGEVAEANRLLGASFQLRGTVVRGDERGRELRLPDRQPRPRRGARLPRSRRLRVHRRRRRIRQARRRRQHRRPPHLQHRSRRADRGLHPRLRRRHLRQRAAPRFPRPPARRASLRGPHRADRADAPGRGAHARDRRRGLSLRATQRR